MNLGLFSSLRLEFLAAKIKKIHELHCIQGETEILKNCCYSFTVDYKSNIYSSNYLQKTLSRKVRDNYQFK